MVETELSFLLHRVEACSSNSVNSRDLRFQQETDHSIWKTLSNEFPVVERCEMWKIMDEAIGILLGRVWGTTTYDAASLLSKREAVFFLLSEMEESILSSMKFRTPLAKGGGEGGFPPRSIKVVKC